MMRFTACLFLLAHSAIAAVAPLSYEEAVQAIIDRSPDVAHARAQRDKTHAHNLPDHLSLLPTLELDGTRSYTKSTGLTPDAFGSLIAVSTEQNVLSGGVGAKLNLFHGGADIQGMRAANSEETAAEADVESQVLTSESEASTAINALIQAEKDRDVFQRILDMREEIVRLSRERFHRGLMAEQEVNKLAIDLDNDRAQLRDTQTSELQARANLIALLGNDNVRLEWPWIERLRQGRPAVLNLGVGALIARPDWQSAETKVRAARQRKWQSLGPILPSLDLSATYLQQQVTYGGAPFTGPYSTATLTLTIPLFDHLNNYSGYAQQVQNVSLAELEFEKLKRSARAEWESAKGALEISLQSARDREQTLAVARRLYEDNLQRFRKGLVSANDLSVDQARLLQSEQLAVKGWNNAHTNFVSVCKALGRRIKDCWHE